MNNIKNLSLLIKRQTFASKNDRRKSRNIKFIIYIINK